ncbi:MAG: hypothetical protein ACLF0P_09650 [Thermoanaerobaculia bacterium]
METCERDVVIAQLVNGLRQRGSWCGATHVQKAMYFLQHLADVPTELDFILYKHGPYSFDLRDELTAMRADLLLEREILSPEYGPSLKVTENGERWCRRHADAVKRIEPAVEFVAERFRDRRVVELERLGTALYVIRKHPNETDPQRLAVLVVDLKPHIDPVEARDAVEEVLRWHEEARAAGLRAA